MADKQTFNHFPQLAKALPIAASRIVRKSAFDVEAAIKQQMTANGQVDTGFMRSSTYVVTSDSSTYGGAGKSGGGTMLPEIPHPPATPPEADIAVGAEYALYQDQGTSRIPARPFMAPAVDRVRPGWEAAWRALEDRLRAINVSTGGGGGA